MAAAGMFVMAALVGSGVDMGRAYRVQNRLQSACDAGALAGRRAVTNNGFDSVAETQANTFFSNNFDEDIQGTHSTTANFEGDVSGNSITVTASTEMDMLLMQLFGNQSMTISVSCSSTMGVGNSDVTMVLDVTGSMSGSPLASLKAAMKNFYTTVDTSIQGSNARVRYAFVPYSTTVNVGQLLLDLNPDYIKDSHTIQSREPVWKTVTTQTQTGWEAPVITTSTDIVTNNSGSQVQYTSTRYNTLAQCNAALPADTAWANNGSPTTTTNTAVNGSNQQVTTTRVAQKQKSRDYYCSYVSGKYRRYYRDLNRTYYAYTYATRDPVYVTETNIVFDKWNYKPVTYDVSALKNFNPVTTQTGTNGADYTTTWDGCIEERQTIASGSISYSNITGMTPAGALDLDIDSAPSDSASQWAPLWRQVAYTRSTLAASNSGSPATSYCVPQAQALQTMEQTEFNAYADSLTAQGNTYLDIGMLWGARLTSPDGIFGDLVNDPPNNGGNVQRHIIFMTDGDLVGANTQYQAYGIETLDRRVTDAGDQNQENARHSQRFRAICAAVRAKGIRLWVIAFKPSIGADLNACGSPGSIFLATNSTQLNAAFQAIAKQVGELRVLQ